MSDAENAVPPESRKRKAYTREQKLEIVKYAKDNNAVLAARQYGVDRTIIGRWCKAENSLKEQREGSRRRDRGGCGRKDEEEEEVANESDHNHAEGFEEPVEDPSPAPLDDLPGEAPPQSSSASMPGSSVAVVVPQPLLAPPEEDPFELLRRQLLEAPPQSSSSASAPVSSVAVVVPQPVLAPPGHLSGEAPPQSSSSASAPVSSVAVVVPRPVLALPGHLSGEAPPQSSSSASAPGSSVAVVVPQPLLAPPMEDPFECLRRQLLEAPQQSSSSASAPESSVAAEVPQPVFVPPEEAPFEYSFVPPEEFPLQPLSAADLGAVYAEGAIPVFATPKKSSGGAALKRGGEVVYEVASIGSHRWVPHGRGKMLEYCVGWRGHDEPTWEKASQFVHANSILKKYRAANNLL